MYRAKPSHGSQSIELGSFKLRFDAAHLSGSRGQKFVMHRLTIYLRKSQHFRFGSAEASERYYFKKRRWGLGNSLLFQIQIDKFNKILFSFSASRNVLASDPPSWLDLLETLETVISSMAKISIDSFYLPWDLPKAQVFKEGVDILKGII
ncbi:hypothetical protein C1645_744559 [Glomus cerebriforme]|uniref:Uncharacterized protein n=1 Tax=Glomus cerebriforme TaxID=658196 RepID=A0A397SBK2_9GLOM|nr:hypothetical protein C1645_744559 [Glomus cerebriforme]